MNYDTFYDSLKDISEVVPALAISLNDCLANGSVPPGEVALSSNGIDDIDTVGHRIYDPLDAINALGGLTETTGPSSEA